MALDIQSKVIGDYEYVVTQLDAVRGRRAVTRFGKLVIPALAEVAGAIGDAKKAKLSLPAKEPAEGEAEATADEDEGIDGVTIVRFAKALERVAEKVTEEDVEYFCEIFAPTTSVRQGDGKSPKLSAIFALHFAGKYEDMMQWLLFCFEVNFGSFFARLGLTRDTSALNAESK